MSDRTLGETEVGSERLPGLQPQHEKEEGEEQREKAEPLRQWTPGNRQNQPPEATPH